MNNRHTKIAAWVMGASLLVAACGGGEADPADSPADGAATPAEGAASPADAGDGSEGSGGDGGGEQLSMILGLRSLGFHQAMACGATTAAAELGAEINVQGAEEYSPQTQIPLVESAAAASPDAIILDPTDAEAMVEPLRAVADSGIGVVTVDASITDDSVPIGAIATDNEAGGVMAADLLGEALAGQEGTVAMISSLAGISTLDARIAGFESQITEYDNLEYVGVEYAGQDSAEATEVMSSLLAAHPDLLGVFGGSEPMGVGIAGAIRTAGAQDVYAISFDVSDAQADLLREGNLDALVVQQPYEMGYQGVEMALANLRGEDYEADRVTETAVIHADEVDSPEAEALRYAGC